MLEGKRILFVDDEEILLESHRNKFKNRPAVSKVIVFYATNVQEAENVINKEPLDLIYLDLSLGESGAPDGLGLLKKYAKSHKIIVISGHEEYKEESFALGAKGFFVKNTMVFNGMMEEGEKILNNEVK
jgi:two-component system response regulator LytT